MMSKLGVKLQTEKSFFFLTEFESSPKTKKQPLSPCIYVLSVSSAVFTPSEDNEKMGKKWLQNPLGG
jgi:hypothetical protein